MVNIHPTLCAVALLSMSSAFAQGPAPATPEAPSLAPATPAPIDPPVASTSAQAVPAEVSTDPTLPAGAVPAAPALSSTSGRLEFQGDDIGLVLRTLARQAKMNIVVSDQVATTAGTVNMRIEDKSPKDAIDITRREVQAASPYDPAMSPCLS